MRPLFACALVMLAGCGAPSQRLADVAQPTLEVGDTLVLSGTGADFCEPIAHLTATQDGRPLQLEPIQDTRGCGHDSLGVNETCTGSCSPPTFAGLARPAPGQSTTFTISDGTTTLELVASAPAALTSVKIVSPADAVLRQGVEATLTFSPSDAQLRATVNSDRAPFKVVLDDASAGVAHASLLWEDSSAPAGAQRSATVTFSSAGGAARCSASSCAVDWTEPFDLSVVGEAPVQR